jgi:membrane carboxypeptidase/penicillin-binding protein PbpC
VAVKTGTTNNLRDNWTIGYTSDRVVLTWVGNNDNQPMSSVASGITGASPIWRQIMNQQLENRATKHAFVTPDGFEKVAVCQVTNTLPCNECPKVVEEIYPLGMAPTTHCTASMFDGEITSAVKTADR